MSRPLSGIGRKPRLEQARGDLETMKASQANIPSSMIREKNRALNSEVLTMVDLDKKNAAGGFEPVMTEAEWVCKNEILGMTEKDVQTKFLVDGRINLMFLDLIMW